MTTWNVKDFGAKGDGMTDDTNSINKAISNASSGDTIKVPKGTYMIDAIKSIKLKSNINFFMDSGAKLQVIPNDKKSYKTIVVRGCSNVKISGGMVVGDRDDHKGEEGEWGHGLVVLGSKNIVVDNVACNDMWGDGFYIDRIDGDRCKDVVLKNVMADRNRRQGLSVIDVNGLQVLNSTFQRTGGTAPEDGIDFEPDRPTDLSKDVIENVLVKGCNFIHNAGAGVEFALKKGIGKNIRITGNKFAGNVGETIKSDTYNWWQKIVYSIFGYPTSLSI